MKEEYKHWFALSFECADIYACLSIDDGTNLGGLARYTVCKRSKKNNVYNADIDNHKHKTCSTI